MIADERQPGEKFPPQVSMPHPKSEAEVKTSATSKYNIKRIFDFMNPTILEYFSGAFLLFGLVLYSTRKAEGKNEYLLVGDDYDEL